MKKVILTTLLMTVLTISFSSCREKSAEEKVENSIEEVGDELENATDDVEEVLDGDK